MLNKFFLACCGSVNREYLGKVRITVGKFNGSVGYQNKIFGSCEVLEGSCDIDRLYSTGGNTYCYIKDDFGRIDAENEATGMSVKMYISNTTSDGYYAYIGQNELFGGTLEGKAYVVNLYGVG